MDKSAIGYTNVTYAVGGKGGPSPPTSSSLLNTKKGGPAPLSHLHSKCTGFPIGNFRFDGGQSSS
jgi:hypothetical protein